MDRSIDTGERIAAAVMAWPGVERTSHRFGGVEFRLGKRELDRLRGDAFVDRRSLARCGTNSSPQDARGPTTSSPTRAG
jgi:hypothetical protein